ncbi:hypothetical protein [Bradyrhizobium sp.]
MLRCLCVTVFVAAALYAAWRGSGWLVDSIGGTPIGRGMTGGDE